MKVLITGASGFIGNHVTAHLLTNGHEVIATSSSQEKARQHKWFKEVAYVPLNLNELDPEVNYFEYFFKPDRVIHLAWQGLPNYNELFHFERNLPQHYSFLKNLVTNGAQDITVTGTCFEYGMQEGELTENLPSLAANSYAIAKDTLRKFLEQLQLKHPYNLKWARLFYMYGPGQNPNSLFSQLEKSLNNNDPVFNMSAGDQLRDYLPVQTMAAYISRIALQNNENGIINCCSGVPVTVISLIEKYLKEQNKTIPLNRGFYPYSKIEPMNFWGNKAKLERAIGG